MGNALSMIRSYLSGRNKKCQFGDKKSTARRIECGISQGSILGPLFFLIYINDLPQCLNIGFLMGSADVWYLHTR